MWAPLPSVTPWGAKGTEKCNINHRVSTPYSLDNVVRCVHNLRAANTPLVMHFKTIPLTTHEVAHLPAHLFVCAPFFSAPHLSLESRLSGTVPTAAACKAKLFSFAFVSGGSYDAAGRGKMLKEGGGRAMSKGNKGTCKNHHLLRGCTVHCVKSRLFSTPGSHGSQGPEFCTPGAVLNGSCTLL